MQETHQSTVDLWPPPEGFVQIPSQMDGVEVYAPAPEKEDERTRTFKCRYCGGTVSYSASQKELTCPYCGQTQAIDAAEVGRRASEFEFTLETMERARHGWGEVRRELVCQSCGAVVTVAPDALTSKCAFCGSNRVLARDLVGEVLRPTTLVPFQVEPNQCKATVLEWLGQGWMHPPELRQVGALQQLIGIYLPFWTFDARVHAHWRAEVGTARTERYRSGGEWHTRTVIDWNWRSGSVTVPVDDHLIPGTRRVSHAILEKVGPFSLDDLVEYDPAYLAGWQAKAYDVQLQEAWEDAKVDIRKAAKKACYQDIASSHVRNFRMTADFGDEEWRYILLPVYLASYRFDSEMFQVMVNGQTGEVAGQKPVAWLRVWLAIAAALTPGAVLGLLGLLTVPLGGIGVIGLVVGFVLFIAGLVGAFFIFQKARASEEV